MEEDSELRLRAEIDKLRRELVTSRRELGETQDRLRLAHEAGRAGTFDWFIPENKVVWSSELETLYGVPVGTFEGAIEHWEERVHPEDSARVLREIGESIASGQRDYNCSKPGAMAARERGFPVKKP